MNVKEIKERIVDECVFDCNLIDCSECPFVTDSDECGGHDYNFDFRAIKLSKVRTLRGLLKYKITENSNNKYPNLINKQNENTK